MNIEQDLEDAARVILADANYGFNAKLAAALTAYGASEFGFVINFTEPSENFTLEKVTSFETGDLSTIKSWPALSLYVDTFQYTGGEKFIEFSGTALVQVDVFLRFQFRDGTGHGMESHKSRSVANAVCHAMRQVFQRRGVAWPSGMTYHGQISGERTGLIPMADGWRNQLSFQLQIEVNR